METLETQTVYEVAAEFRCSARKVADVARANGIGAQLGGRAGWRFTEADKRALLAAMRPARPRAKAKDGSGRLRKGRRSPA